MRITTKHASNSSVTFVTHMCFAVLFSLPSCCVNSLILSALPEVRQVTNTRTICEAFNTTPVTKTLLGEVPKLLQMYMMTLGNLSKDVFQLRTSSGSDTVSHLTCLNTTKIVLLSILSLIKKICRTFG